MAQNFTTEEVEQLKILKDPVLWCEAYLRNPEDPSQPLRLRYYQKDILRCQDKHRLLRCGRGIGKSISFISDMLYTAFVNPNFDLILICPTEHQVREMFDYVDKVALASDILRSSIPIHTRQPFVIGFGNGSKIKGYSLVAGSKIYTKNGIKNIENIKENDILLTFDQSTNTFKHRKCTYVYDTNYKEVFDLELSNGAEVTISEDHPLFTENGWMKLKDLKVGDKVISSTNYEEYDFPDINYSDDELFVLGCLIGDGTLVKSHAKWGFTCGNKKLQERFEGSLERMGVYFTKSISQKTGSMEYSLGKTTDQKFRHWKTKWNRLYEIVTENDLEHYAHEKKLSNKLLSVSNRQVKILLEGLIATDGYVSQKSLHMVEYYSTSKQLVKDVQHLLRRIGIKSRRNSRDNKESYVLMKDKKRKITPRHRIHRLIVGGKADLCRLSTLEVPGKPFDYIKSKITKSYQSRPIWEMVEIKSVTPAGKATTYDISVDGTECFIANDIVLHNTAGVKSGSKALSARGVSGDRIYIDECDYLDDDSLDTLMPLFHRRTTTKVLVSSTPSGKRGHYFTWATNKSLGWKEFYYPASVAPTWVSIDDAQRRGLPQSASTEYQARTSMTEDAYVREYDASFGEELNGVFKHAHIDQCIHRYRYEDLFFDPKSKYSLGVDWNGEENGVQMVILEYFPISDDKILNFVRHDDLGLEEKYQINARGKFRVTKRISISAKEATQRKAIETIIYLNNQYRFDWIGVDAGFGTHQIEDIKAYGKENPGTGLDKKLIPIEFGGTTEIFDPVSKQKVWKYTKPYMVGVTQNIIEMHDLIVSSQEEDYKRFLVDQLRNYRIKSAAGNPDRPVYIKGNDHMLDALMCAIFVFHLNNSEYTYIQHSDRAYLLDTNIFSHQESVDARWKSNDVQIGMRVAEPKLLDKVPANAGYSYTIDPRSQHDDPNTEFIYKRNIEGRGAGPWDRPNTVENKKPSTSGKEPSRRSIFGNASPRANSWSPFGR